MGDSHESMSERLPDFLIVGAMKAGTTTLYRDLLTQPAVYMPIDKEPHRLMTDAVLTPEGRAEYASLFRRARPDQVCGEASTGYTKAPDAVGVPDRALCVLGPETKIIYLVREPVARVRSHHFHEFSAGNAPASIDEAVQSMPALLNYTRYAWQIRPWIERFGRANVRILKFEDYARSRRATLIELGEWLGFACEPERVLDSKVYNRSKDKATDSGPAAKFSHSEAYRRMIRPLLPSRVRDALRWALLPKAPEPPRSPSEVTVEQIRERLKDDTAELQQIMGWQSPIWDEARTQPDAHGAPERTA